MKTGFSGWHQHGNRFFFFKACQAADLSANSDWPIWPCRMEWVKFKNEYINFFTNYFLKKFIFFVIIKKCSRAQLEHQARRLDDGRRRRQQPLVAHEGRRPGGPRRRLPALLLLLPHQAPPPPPPPRPLPPPVCASQGECSCVCVWVCVWVVSGRCRCDL